jgi:WD40 repeat protein
MEQLPEECLDIIASYLDVRSVARLGLSSTRLRSFCFSARYWTDVDFSVVPNEKVTKTTIDLLSKSATELKILNIQNCKNVNLDELVPLVFNFKRLELIKHDNQHRLLDETVAINRMLNNAENLIKLDGNQSSDAKGAQYDNAVRQARALLWDALFVVVANKRGTKHILPDEAYFSNIVHPQETLDLVMNKLRATEKMLQQPHKLWPNSMTCKTPIKRANFVKDPRTQKIYLACGVAGEIVIWDVDTRSVFKVFNYLDSFPRPTKKNVKKQSSFMGALLFKHMDRVLLLGGTSTGAVCWDYDTQQIVYENSMPSKTSGGYTSKYYATNWAITDKGEGFVRHYGGAFLFDLGTGELGMKLKEPKGQKGSKIAYSSKNNGLVLHYLKKNEDGESTFEIINMFTDEVVPVMKLPAPKPRLDEDKDSYSSNTLDWFDDRLIALAIGTEVVIYKSESSENKYALLSKIEFGKKLSDIRFLSDELILCEGQHIFNVNTGALEISLQKGARGSNVIYSPELKLIARTQHVGVVALYNAETKQRIGPEPCATPVCTISKLDDDTILLHGNYSTFSSFVNYHGLNYAKVSIRGGQFKVLETVDTPLQILDVSTDGKYALAQNECHAWDDRHDVEFSVFELETKKVIFKRKFLHESSTSTWYVSPVGQFMPQHTDQVLLAHQENGFQIFDVKSGEVLRDFTDAKYGGVEDHVKISSDERYVIYKTVKANMGGNVVVDMMEQTTYSLKGHTNTADSLTFNPVNPTQVLTAGCGIRVFNLPSEKHIFVTRYLDGLIQTVRESEEIASLKFSADGKYLAALDPPSRSPWGLEIANTLVRVYETTNFTLVSSFDTGGQARALHWIDNERAIIVLISGKILSLQLVVKEYKKLFDYIVQPKKSSK